MLSAIEFVFVLGKAWQHTVRLSSYVNVWVYSAFVSLERLLTFLGTFMEHSY